MDTARTFSRSHVLPQALFVFLFLACSAVLSSVAFAADVPAPAKEFFDDFSYTSPTDQAFRTSGWSVRNLNPEYPGPPGAQWKTSNVRFARDPSDNANTLMTLVATARGSAGDPSQAEVSTTARFFEGTYAARVRFADSPESGPDVDKPVEAFYALNGSRYEDDSLYSECDFEYLPNGGWNLSGSRIWFMTWEKFSLIPWSATRLIYNEQTSLDGWHTLVFQISGGQVRYYIDGALKATHVGPDCPGNCYPEGNIAMAFELWFVIADGIGSSTDPREYHIDVDWAYHARDEALSDDDVTSIVAAMRASGVARKDTMDAAAPPASGRLAWHSYTAYDETRSGNGVRPLDAVLRFHDFATGTSFGEGAIDRGVRHAMNPRFSRDGARVVFEGLPAGGSYGADWRKHLDIFTYNFKTGALVNLSDAAQLGESIDEEPDFSSDGSKVVFERDDADLWVMNLSTWAMTRLTVDSTAVVESHPRYSPDGRYVAYSAGAGTGAAIMRVSSSGGAPQTIVDNSSINDCQPVYADATHLLFTRWERSDTRMDDVYLCDTSAKSQRWALANMWRSADESDPFPVSGNLFGFSSNRQPGQGQDIFVGNLATGAVTWVYSAGTGKDELGGCYCATSVGGPSLAIAASELPHARLATAYSQTFAASGGLEPYAWSVISGRPPAGLSLSSEGVLSGTPSSMGTATFAVRVTDAASPAVTADRSFSVTVDPPPPVVTTSSLADGEVAQGYSQLLEATGGMPPFTWSVASGALPDGLSVGAASGAISGTPLTAGTFNFTVRVTDTGGGAAAEKALHIDIVDHAGPAVSSAASVPTFVRFDIDSSATVTATATDVGLGATAIAAAEYSIGTAAKPGGGTPMTASDGAFDSETETVDASIDVSTWHLGNYSVYVRAKDAAGNWGNAARYVMRVAEGIPPAPITDLELTPVTAFKQIAGAPWSSPGSALAGDRIKTIDLHSTRTVEAVSLAVGDKAFFPQRFAISISTDNVLWTLVAAEADYRAVPGVHLWQMEPRACRYVAVTAAPVRNPRDELYYLNVAEVAVYEGQSGSLVRATWTATANNGTDSSSGRASAYELRFSAEPLDAAGFASGETAVLPSPGAPGASESATFAMGNLTGKVYAAIKSADAIPNWSDISNIASVDAQARGVVPTSPDDVVTAAGDFAVDFACVTAPDVAGTKLAFSDRLDFPSRPVKNGDAVSSTVRALVPKTGRAWRPAGALAARLKKLSLGRTLYWRLEGRSPLYAAIHGPVRSILFETGGITGLSVAGAHTSGSDDALWPDTAAIPVFKWTDDTVGMKYTCIDVSVDSTMPLKDAARTTVLSGMTVTASNARLTVAQWRKMRQLAASGGGVLYWRVRAQDRDKVLYTVSPVKKLVIDGGTWAVGPLDLDTTAPEISCVWGGQGIARCSFQFSTDPAFPPSAKTTLKTHPASVAVSRYVITPAEKKRILALAARNSVTTLYFRAIGEDADKAFVTPSQAQTAAIPQPPPGS